MSEQAYPPQPQARQPRPHRTRQVLLIILAVLVLLLLGAWIYDYVGRTRLDDSVLEAQAQGLPVSFADIENVMKQWPEDQNGAKLVLDMAERLDEINSHAWELDLPGFSPRLSLGTQLPEEAQEQAFAEVAGWAVDIARLDQVLNYERGWIGSDLMPHPFDSIGSDPYRQLRNAARLKAFQIEAEANRGNTDGLVRDMGVMFRLARFASQPPALLGSLVETAINNLAVSTIETACALAHPSDDQLIALDHLLSEIDLLGSFQASLVGERAYTIGAAQPFTRLIPSDLRIVHTACTGDGCSHSHTPTWVPGLVGWHRRNHAQTLNALTRALAVEADPNNPHRFYTELRRELEPRDSSYHLSNVLLASLSRALDTTTRSQAEVTCARVALAAERYRRATGDFPETLDRLVPDYLEELPHDPFDGQPLRYKVTDEHVVIYSVGENLTDDGGMVECLMGEGQAKDFGFVLLPPDKRGQPASDADKLAGEMSPEQIEH